MKNDKNNDFDSVEMFFKKHFDSMPKFEQDKQRDEELLNSILMDARKKREFIESDRNKQFIDFKSIKKFFKEKRFTSPKYAYTVIAVILVISLYIYVNSDISIIEEFSIAIQETVETIETGPNVSNNIDIPDIANDNLEISQSSSQIDIVSSELGYVSYDFSSRSVQSKNNNKQSIDVLVINIIESYLKSNNILYSRNQNVIETEWLTESNKSVQIRIDVITSSKDLKFTLYKQNNLISNKQVNTKDFKNSLEDRIFNELNP